MSLQALQTAVSDWSAETFGRPDSGQPLAIRLVHEALELVKAPEDLEEGADCLILLLNWAERAGYSADDLVQAAWLKHQKNQDRQWAEQSNGTWHHKEKASNDHDRV